tara:strand:+ start:158 stop:1072 length:915 start_codon:yes stop_codon:yes gene_type:complete
MSVILAYIVVSCTVTRPVVKVAIVAPFTGIYREIGYQVLNGARIAVKEHNNNNSNVPSLELIAFDDAGDPTRAVEQAHKILTDEKVIAVIGHWLDQTTAAAAPVYMNANIPLVATSASPSNPNNAGVTFFRLHPTVTQISTEIERLSKTYRIHSVCNCGLYEAAEFLEALNNNNSYTTAVGGPLWSLQAFHNITGIRSEGSFFIVPAPQPMLENESAPYLIQYQIEYPYGPDPTWLSLHAYESINIIANAIETTKVSTSKSVAISLSRIDYHGLIGRVQFDSFGQWIEPQIRLYKWNNATISLP